MSQGFNEECHTPTMSPYRKSLRPTPIKAGIILAVSLAGASAFGQSITAAAAAQTGSSSKGTLYVIGYSHLDTQWCWTYPQVIREFIPNTLDDNFKLFQEYPDYVFNWTGSNRYVFMKEYYPKRYAELKKYIAEGRWFPAGSCIEEGDVNSPSMESIVRQVLYANDFFRSEFGIASSEFMLPDCFGFPADLPTALAFSGLKGFSTQKLTWGSAVGIPFNVGQWVGLDGESITAALNPGSYGSDIRDNLANDSHWVNRMKDNIAKSEVGVDYRYYGVGDRGGAPDPLSVANLEASIHTDGQIKVKGGAADAMFNALTASQKKALPHYKGDLELMQHSTGSLSSEGAMKRWNRKNEFLGETAEKAASAANWLGSQPYPKAAITNAWLRFLPGQFHDLMAGTALPLAYTYTWNDEVLAMNQFADVLNHSANAVIQDMDTRPAKRSGVTLSVYNPLSVSRNDLVSADVTFPGSAPKHIQVISPSGETVPSQIDSSSGSTLHIVFLASAPSLGYANYSVVPAAKDYSGSSLKVTNRTLESSRYKVTLNNAGDVQSIYDKALHRELLSGTARLEYQYENPSEYPAWNMDWDDQNKPPRGYVDGPAKFKIVENGPVRVGLQVVRHSQGSVFYQTIELGSGAADAQVVFKTKIDWHGKECALKAAFPLTAHNDLASYNLGYGVIQRPTNSPKLYEDLHHQWFDLTDSSGKWGTTIMDDCKYGSDKPDDHTVRLTLIYTPGVRGGFQHQATQDWGRNIMTYSLEGHSGDWHNGNAQWQAKRLNQPLIAFQAPAHDGPAGRDFSFSSVSSPNVSIEALKQAENSDSIVVHLSELAGKTEMNVKLRFAAPIKSVKEINGQEFPISPTADMKLVNGVLVFNMTKYHPRAFELTLAKPSQPLHAPKSQPLDLPFNLDVLSTHENPADGNFDGQGDSIPGELLPKKLVSGGVDFAFGSDAKGAENAVSCQGQTLSLPAGKNRTFCFLASSSDGDTTAAFKVGNASRNVSIQNWGGYIGQWDTRLWGGKVPELTYNWSNPIIGLVPGYIKRDPVAWYADHHRTADGKPDIYSFCYLFRYEIKVPNGVSSITLPNQPGVKIMAASVVWDQHTDAVPAQPLYDVIKNRRNENGPAISPAGGSFTKEVKVSIEPPLYWSPSDNLHYTLDGSTPTSQSPVYTGSIILDRPAVVKAALVGTDGKAGETASASFEVNDKNSPAISSVLAFTGSDKVVVSFSKPVDDKAAADASRYQADGLSILSAVPAKDGQSVTLELSQPLSEPTTLKINGLTDGSQNRNPLSPNEAKIECLSPAFTQPESESFSGSKDEAKSFQTPGLPGSATEPWSVSMWVKVDSEPTGMAVIGGFGNGQDSEGTQRYLAAFDGHPHFWGSSVDLSSPNKFKIGAWEMITITYDGHEVRMYENGDSVASKRAFFSDAESVVKLAPNSPWDNGHNFAGQVSGLTVWSACLPEGFIKILSSGGPSAALSSQAKKTAE